MAGGSGTIEKRDTALGARSLYEYRPLGSAAALVHARTHPLQSPIFGHVAPGTKQRFKTPVIERQQPALPAGRRNSRPHPDCGRLTDCVRNSWFARIQTEQSSSPGDLLLAEISSDATRKAGPRETRQLTGEGKEADRGLRYGQGAFGEMEPRRETMDKVGLMMREHQLISGRFDGHLQSGVWAR
ncbi:hypothetical protein CCMA1212_007007 [Trichoderma ghanense]|uniref:Uncharacterized protein n=1 Tax=Trichoderma ghanense TaxID=65468 RepID=A0ABY2H0V5_9HYPO